MMMALTLNMSKLIATISTALNPPSRLTLKYSTHHVAIKASATSLDFRLENTLLSLSPAVMIFGCI
jgi:hypothetical protein